MATFDHRCVQLQLFAKGCGCFARQTDHRETVRAVGSDFKFDLCVVETDCLANRHPEGMVTVVAQYKDTVLNGIRKIVLCQP